MSKEKSVEELSALVLSGQSSEQERGMFLRAVQVGMSSNLVSQLNALHSVMAKATEIYSTLDEQYLNILQEEIREGVLTKEEIRIERNALENRIMAILTLERQVLQGKSLFPEDTLSEDDKKVLRILGTIKTKEEREKFFKAIDAYFKGDNSFETEE